MEEGIIEILNQKRISVLGKEGPILPELGFSKLSPSFNGVHPQESRRMKLNQGLMKVLGEDLEREVFGIEEMAEFGRKLIYIVDLGGPIRSRHVTGSKQNWVNPRLRLHPRCRRSDIAVVRQIHFS